MKNSSYLRREFNKMIRTWEGNDTETSLANARMEARAKQRKYECDVIRSIIMDNLQYQIKKRIADHVEMDYIMNKLGDSNSKLYQEILAVTVKRTDSTIALRDISAKRKIAEGEEDVKLINPKNEPLEKRIIKQFEFVAKAMVLAYKDRTSVDKRLSSVSEDR